VEIGRDIADLLIGHRHRGHAFIRPAATADLAYLVTPHVMRNERRADQVRPSSAGGIGPMTESAGLLELLWPRSLQDLENQPEAEPRNSME